MMQDSTCKRPRREKAKNQVNFGVLEAAAKKEYALLQGKSSLLDAGETTCMQVTAHRLQICACVCLLFLLGERAGGIPTRVMARLMDSMWRSLLQKLLLS